MKSAILSRIWGLRKPRRLASVILRRLHLSHLFTIRTSGIRLRFFPAVWTALLWEHPDYFHRDTDLLRRWLRPGDVLVDCGANVGLLTVVGAVQVGGKGHVYAIEAHPRTFGFLQANVALNNVTNVDLVNAAVGEKEGSIAFSDQGADDGRHVATDGGGIRVPMKPLDSLIPRGTPVRLLKIDVEGYELRVLDGAPLVLQATEAMYFESSDVLFTRYGYTCTDLFDRLRQTGFTLYRVDRDNSMHKLSEDYVSRQIENLIAVRNPGEFIQASGFSIA